MIKEELIEKYKKATNKLLLLDYDGTLVNYETIPDKALPTKELLDVLHRLTNVLDLKVIIISGRSAQDMDNFLRHVPIDIIAEHGAMFKEHGVWKKQFNVSDSWKQKVHPVLNSITLACPNSFIEDKPFSLVWHYRNIDQESGYNKSRELIQNLENIISTCDLKLLDGNKVIEIMAKGISKGKAVERLLEQTSYDYILAIGDDKTDEEMFEFLMHNVNADTVKVSNGATFAKYRVDDVNEVINLLEQLSTV